MIRRKLMTAALILALTASLTACGAVSESGDKEYIYGKIDSVSGNDIVLLMAEYNENADSSEEDSDKSSEKKSSDDESEESGSKRSFKMPENGEMPEGFDPESFAGKRLGGSSDEDGEEGQSKRSFKMPENGEMPEGFDPESFAGKRPGGSSDEDGEEGEGKRSFKMPENGEMPEGFDPESFAGKRPGGSSDDDSDGSEKSFRRSSSSNSRYTLTGETEELRIPVGVTVTTSLGVKTDFDALSAGDIIKCSVEKNSDGEDVVTEVWIMEQ